MNLTNHTETTMLLLKQIHKQGFTDPHSDSKFNCLICESSIPFATRGAIVIEEIQKMAKHKRLRSQLGITKALETFLKKLLINEKTVAAEGAIATTP